MTEILSNEQREDLLEWIEELAEGYGNQYGGCAESVINSLQRKLDLPGGSTALKSATFFTLGTAHMGGACGALVGGIMSIGLASGRESIKGSPYPEPKVIDPTLRFPKSLVHIANYYKKFVETFGGSTCREIQIKTLGRSYDLLNLKEFMEFHRLTKESCPAMMGKAARLAAETILEMPRR